MKIISSTNSWIYKEEFSAIVSSQHKSLSVLLGLCAVMAYITEECRNKSLK
jgi:hypothetical protein